MLSVFHCFYNVVGVSQFLFLQYLKQGNKIYFEEDKIGELDSWCGVTAKEMILRNT